MRILVIGVNGQVARSMVARAQFHAAEVVTLGRPDLDLSDLPSISDAVARHPADVIVNAAAYTAVDQAEKEVAAAFALNAAAPRELARAAARMGAPLVHLSTDYVFSGSDDGWRRETDPVGPLGVYGRSKLEGEQAVREETARHVILRTAWVFSPYGRNFVKTMLQLAAQRDEIRVVADQFGSPTYAPDLADGIFAVCRNVLASPDAASVYGVFHMTGSGSVSWADFAVEIFAISARMGGPTAKVSPIQTVEYPTPARRPSNSRLSNDRLRAVHGVSLPDWRDGLERCLAALIPNESLNL